jgi:hypothetical protein
MLTVVFSRVRIAGGHNGLTAIDGNFLEIGVIAWAGQPALAERRWERTRSRSLSLHLFLHAIATILWACNNHQGTFFQP